MYINNLLYLELQPSFYPLCDLWNSKSSFSITDKANPTQAKVKEFLRYQSVGKGAAHTEKCVTKMPSSGSSEQDKHQEQKCPRTHADTPVTILDPDWLHCLHSVKQHYLPACLKASTENCTRSTCKQFFYMHIMY